MPTLLFVRHSKALANEQGILMGAKLDSPLSSKGILLAKEKAQLLRKQGFAPAKVYTSRLKRAIQTAQIFVEELGVDVEIAQLTELNERDFGIHDGKPYESVLAAFAKYGDNPPTIEPVTAFIDRVLKALEQIKHEASGPTLIVTHSNPLMVLQTALLYPQWLQRFWELGDPEYCEGFSYELNKPKKE